MKRWYAAALCAVAVGCSGSPHTAIPGAVPMGVLGPRLNLRIARIYQPHYFYNRYVFQERVHRRPHTSPTPIPGPLLYGGGAVQIAPVTHLIFWGWSGPTDAVADPDGMAPFLVKFFGVMPASSWLNTVTQYYQDLGTYENITNPAGQYAGATYDSSAVPGTFTDTDVQNEALKYANSTLGYSASANYIVVAPHGKNISGFGSQFCAYHSAVGTTSGGILSYTVLPYIPDAGYGCGANAVAPYSGQPLDGVSIVSGHEEAETITDPDASTGWLDAGGNEIADKCAWYDLQDTQFGGTTYGTNMFATQPLWSNAAGSSSPCVQSYSGASPTPTPSPPPSNAVRNPGFETGRLKPWVTCESKGKLPAALTTTRKPHSGKYDAYAGTLDGKEPDGITSVCQLVNVPAGAQLTVWVRGISDDKRNGVFQFGRLYNTSRTVAKTLFKFNANQKSWVQERVDLSAYANGQYWLAFGVQGRRNARGHFIGLFVDDVSLAP